MNNKYASSTHTASTSSVPDRYWKEQEEGYRAGFQWGVKQINGRFENWFLVGICLGMVGGFFIQSGFWTFLSVVGIIYLIDKLKKIEIKKP